MKQVNKIILLALGFGLLGPALSFIPGNHSEAAGPASVKVVTTRSEPLNTTLPTHLGVQPSTFVALRCNRFVGPTCTEFRRLKPDATEDQVTFQIPKGTNLIITDLAWQTEGGRPGVDDSRLLMEVNPGPLIYFSSSAPTDSAGRAYMSQHFTTGFRFSKMPSFVLVPNTPDLITIQGYLVNQ